jgi:hypothetical protein
MKKTLVILAVLGFLSLAVAQEAPKEQAKETPKAASTGESKPLGAYKLDFVLRELVDNKLVNTRSYSLIIDDGYHSAGVKIGSRVPVTGDKGINYLDIGTNIRCNHITGQSPWILLDCAVEVSSFSLPEQKTNPGENAPPVLNQMRADIPAVVREGKQTVIGVIDDPSSTKSYEIVVTATKII